MTPDNPLLTKKCGIFDCIEERVERDFYCQKHIESIYPFVTSNIYQSKFFYLLSLCEGFLPLPVKDQIPEPNQKNCRNMIYGSYEKNRLYCSLHFSIFTEESAKRICQDLTEELLLTLMKEPEIDKVEYKFLFSEATSDPSTPTTTS